MRKRKKETIPFSKGEVTFLANDVHIKGDVCFAGNLEIEGQVTGNILAEGDREARVRIAPGGVVRGDIRVSHIIVGGKVEGTLHSSGQIELSDGAVVEGNLHYRLLEVEKGAVVNGNFIQEQRQEQDAEPAAGEGDEAIAVIS